MLDCWIFCSVGQILYIFIHGSGHNYSIHQLLCDDLHPSLVEMMFYMYLTQRKNTHSVTI